MTTTRLPALGLEGTAARILAACAAREVGPWEASLPKAIRCGRWGDRCAAALSDIAAAMVYAGVREMALTAIRSAAAEARAWRLSLPQSEQGAPVVLASRYSVRSALRMAIRCLCSADLSCGSLRGRRIRSAEAYLRAAGEVLLASGAE